ncbi:hypothetical protein ACIGCK_14555 [Microbacterium sp. NPDC078428]|uniref:hypothetical protein n=1 Tax=Microbacterium sp. NPDC078428 TaxID=3364190 RepID=UPI0037CB36B8
MTEPDTNTIRWLNLLYGSPSFVIRIDPRSQTPTVVQINVVPNDGTYWIAGTTILPRGDLTPSVFKIDTSVGGSLAGACWKIDGTWMPSSEKMRILPALDAEEVDVFPFDWPSSIPLPHDVDHDDAATTEGMS